MAKKQPKLSYGNYRQRKFIAEKGKCEWCGSTEKLTIDHKVPRCLGGKNGKVNWQVLCSHCNHSIKAKQEQDLYLALMMCYAPEVYRNLKWINRPKNCVCTCTDSSCQYCRRSLPITALREDELVEIYNRLVFAIGRNAQKKNPKNTKGLERSFLRIEAELERRRTIMGKPADDLTQAPVVEQAAQTEQEVGGGSSVTESQEAPASE